MTAARARIQATAGVCAGVVTLVGIVDAGVSESAPHLWSLALASPYLLVCVTARRPGSAWLWVAAVVGLSIGGLSAVLGLIGALLALWLAQPLAWVASVVLAGASLYLGAIAIYCLRQEARTGAGRARNSE